MKTLVIIGNGFDLAHSLPTRFSDFIQSNNYYQEKYRIFKGTNWNDIELNYKKLIFDIMSERNEIIIEELLDNILSDYGYDKYGFVDYVPLTSDTFISETDKVMEYVNLLTEFEHDFLAYLKDNCDKDRLNRMIPKSKIKKILDSSSHIINFNYTNVVEEVYHIKEVKHIHGTISEENIAIGTDALNTLKESMIDSTYPTEYPCKDKYDFQERMRYYIEGSDGKLYEDEQIRSLFNSIEEKAEEDEKKLIKLIDAKNKDTISSRIEEKNYLKKTSFDQVIILGHSINNADLPVFKEINKDAKLICYYYELMQEKDLNKIKTNLDDLNINYELRPNGDIYK